MHFPWTSPPTPGLGRIVYCRAYSQWPYAKVFVRMWMYPPLVNGQFQGPEPTSRLIRLPDTTWTVNGSKLEKVFPFVIVPTAAQVADGVCFLLRYENPNLTGCTSTCALNDTPYDPLAAVFDRPW